MNPAQPSSPSLCEAAAILNMNYLTILNMN